MRAFRSFVYLGFLLFVSSASNAGVKILLDEDFESGAAKVTPGWGIGSQGEGKVKIVDTASEQINSKSKWSLRASYPASQGGGLLGWASFDMEPYKTDEVYVEFNAKMPKAKQGIKFLKIFGQVDPVTKGYANTTFPLDYTGVSSGKGSLAQIGFGDGTSLQNDTQNVIYLTGSYPDWIGRSYGKAVVKIPEGKGFHAEEWGDDWHHFRVKVKFNTVTKTADQKYIEVNDGEYFLQIDGRVYLDAKGLFNRHPSNGPIAKVALLDWSQNIDKEFEIWYDNVKITTGGFDTSEDPSSDQIKPNLN